VLNRLRLALDQKSLPAPAIDAAPARARPALDAPPAWKLERAFEAAGGSYSEASATNWKHFWASKPTVVGVDAEGTQHSPPLLVQVAFAGNRVLLEAPSAREGVSADLQRLLADASIAKCFFGPPDNEGLEVPMANVVDVQAAAKGKVAHTNPKHGPSLVAAVRTLAPGVPDAANLVKNKKIQQSFGFMFRSRKKDFLHELSHARKLYAAADAWATLEVARSLYRTDPEAVARNTLGTPDGPGSTVLLPKCGAARARVFYRMRQRRRQERSKPG